MLTFQIFVCILSPEFILKYNVEYKSICIIPLKIQKQSYLFVICTEFKLTFFFF